MLRNITQSTASIMANLSNISIGTDYHDDEYFNPSPPIYFRVNTTTYRLFMDLFNKVFKNITDIYLNTTVCDETKHLVTEAPTRYELIQRWINPVNDVTLDGEISRGLGQPALSAFENCTVEFLDTAMRDSHGNFPEFAHGVAYGMFFGILSFFALCFAVNKYGNYAAQRRERNAAIARGEQEPIHWVETFFGQTALRVYRTMEAAPMQQRTGAVFAV